MLCITHTIITVRMLYILYMHNVHKPMSCHIAWMCNASSTSGRLAWCWSVMCPMWHSDHRSSWCCGCWMGHFCIASLPFQRWIAGTMFTTPWHGGHLPATGIMWSPRRAYSLRTGSLPTWSPQTHISTHWPREMRMWCGAKQRSPLEWRSCIPHLKLGTDGILAEVRCTHWMQACYCAYSVEHWDFDLFCYTVIILYHKLPHLILACCVDI